MMTYITLLDKTIFAWYSSGIFCNLPHLITGFYQLPRVHDKLHENTSSSRHCTLRFHVSEKDYNGTMGVSLQ